LTQRAAAANQVELSGVISQLGALRHTPAGVPVAEFRLKHDSERTEAGATRKVDIEIDAIAFQAQARLVAKSALGRPLKVEGFLSARSRRSRKPVLHVTKIEFIEGD
jgi:primosomal replication protein N